MKTRIFFLFFTLFTFLVDRVEAQETKLDVMLQPVDIEGLVGVQSYAVGIHDGKWLVIGGRKDGLHQRQPFASFDAAGNNTDILVIDPVSQKFWRKTNSSLPAALREQLSATNPEFFQDGAYLYIIGGYGFSPTANNHVTFPNLCVVNVPDLIEAIIQNKEINPYFRQIVDEKLAVTGGYLHKVYDTYYLVGGQKFTGRYNPQGPGHGPGFVQDYTNAIRKFRIEDDGVNLKVTHTAEIIDEANLHRRDYNVASQVFPDGTFGLTAFSGVFQKSADVPFLNCVNIDSSGYAVQPDFNQYYNHYHCAHLPVYSESKKEMHTLFFGGISQYYDDNGVLTRDDNVPFVNTIARVTRDKDGNMAEYKLRHTMPGLLGSGSEFIFADDMPVFENGVLKLDALPDDTTHVGYIYGGINSSAPNIFFTNTGTQSTAENRIFKVYLIQHAANATDEMNSQSLGGLGMMIYPNPGRDFFHVKYHLKYPADVHLTIQGVDGQLIKEINLGLLTAGSHDITLPETFSGHKVLLFTLRAGDQVAVQKLILHD